VKNWIVELYEGLTVAIDATTDCILLPNLCNGVRAGIAAAKPCGVAVHAMASGEYGWVQICGVATVAVKTTTTLAAGKDVMAGADSGVLLATAGNPIVGTCLSAVDDYMAIDLKL
jgi:predicted RecA/RadA family phage recombinase